MIMASSQAKIGWKSSRKGEKKNYRSVSFLADASQKISKKKVENFKKKGKKFKKLKNTIIASFQANVSWKSPNKGENKNFRSISFLPET